jgi:hypothetical protein
MVKGFTMLCDKVDAIAVAGREADACHCASRSFLQAKVYFPLPPIITRPVSDMCIDHFLTMFLGKVASFGTRFSPALSDHYFMSFSYCVRPLPSVDRFVSFKDVSCVNVDFLAFQVRLLNWDVFYATSDVDLQLSLLTDFVNHLYDVCVLVRWKFITDPRTPSEDATVCALVRMLFVMSNFRFPT